jgi:hypothetical protein
MSRIARRQFLGSAAATAAFFAAHDLAAMTAQRAVTPQPEPRRPRLLSLELLTSAPLATMQAFYGKTLDLLIRANRQDQFGVEAGETRLTFAADAAKDPGGTPFYHFAFNIPENKIRQALEWQQKRTPVLTVPEPYRAAGYPPEVMEHRGWNAHSIFFTDPAGNVIEYIARHDLKNGDTIPFSWADLLYVSEIGLIVDDVAAEAARLAAATSLSAYKDNTGGAAAIGDEYGLLMLMKRGRPFDVSPAPQRAANVYRAALTLRAAKAGKHEVQGYPYRITLEERCSCA